MNKYELTKRQLRLAHNRIQISEFYFFCQKLEVETVRFENPKPNLNNHYNGRTGIFVTFLTVQSLCV